MPDSEISVVMEKLNRIQLDLTEMKQGYATKSEMKILESDFRGQMGVMARDLVGQAKDAISENRDARDAADRALAEAKKNSDNLRWLALAVIGAVITYIMGRVLHFEV